MVKVTPEVLQEYKEYGLFTGADVFASIPSKIPVIEGIISERDVICISSQAGKGKSILALQMACCLSSGTDFLDTYKISRPYRVLYVQTEGDRTETVERLRKMEKGVLLDEDNFFHYNSPGLCLNTTGGMTDFLNNIAYAGVVYDVIIIDPLYTTVKGTLVSDETATDWFREIRRLRTVYPNITIIVIHHDGKAQVINNTQVDRADTDIFGSNFWSAIFSNNFKLKGRGNVFALDLGKGRAGPDKVTTKIGMRFLHPVPLMYAPDDEFINETTAMLEAIMKKDPHRAFRRLELENMIDKSKTTVWRSLKLLEEQYGRIQKLEKEGLTVYRWRS